MPDGPNLLDDIGEGRDVTVAPYDLAIGTERAAEILGLSRPWLTASSTVATCVTWCEPASKPRSLLYASIILPSARRRPTPPRPGRSSRPPPNTNGRHGKDRETTRHRTRRSPPGSFD
jgi:hypothetical protein